MPRITPTSWRILIRVFEAYGCQYKRKKRSHHVITYPGAKRAVVTPEYSEIDVETAGTTKSATRADGLAELCRQSGVAIVYVFGSRAREVRDWVNGDGAGQLSGAPDVDVGVRPQPEVRWDVVDKVRLAIDLEDLFGCGRVDLVVLPEADPFLAAEIIRGERLFSRDEYEADEYDLYVLRRAGDLIPLERERLALITQGTRD